MARLSQDYDCPFYGRHRPGPVQWPENGKNHSICTGCRQRIWNYHKFRVWRIEIYIIEEEPI